MKKSILFLICLFACSIGFAKEPTGASKICDDIGYLSTTCKSVDVLPMEYKDKDVAIAKAQSDAKEEITNIILNMNKIIDQVLEESKNKDDIIVKTWFEEE